jgi:hypothetical protein
MVKNIGLGAASSVANALVADSLLSAAHCHGRITVMHYQAL